jgi:MYXO-CTERM domain-containing protein
MRTPVLSAAAALALASPLVAQNPVYTMPGETGGPFTYLTISEQVEYADSAHLSGTERLLDQAAVTLYSNVARQATVTLSFYQAVPYEGGVTGGQPGVTPGDLAAFRPADTPLWTSGPVVFQIAGDGADNLNLNQLLFADINTLVPDDLFWSVKFEAISNYSDGGAFGPKLEDAVDLAPTGASTDPSRLYLRGDFSAGEWQPVWLASNAPPTSSLSLQLTAHPVPEPSVALLAAGVLAAWRRRRA